MCPEGATATPLPMAPVPSKPAPRTPCCEGGCFAAFARGAAAPVPAPPPTPCSHGIESVALSATKPTFQMPVEWPVGIALRLARLASDCHEPTRATVQGFSTPSTTDVGAASVRLRIPEPLEGVFAEQGSVTLGVRRAGTEAWLPAIAGVPGHHADRAGIARHGLLEMLVMARPTTKGCITFVHEEALRDWAPVGQELELCPLKRLDDFHIDDGSGPWLRDRICITSSQAEDFASTGKGEELPRAAVQDLLRGTGFSFKPGAYSPAPMDEWDLTRVGQYHRDVA